MNPDSVSLFKDRWRVASDRARPIQQHRVDAYAALSSSLKDPKRLSPELLAHLCSERESITAQILMDLGSAQCRTEALHFLGCYIFHTEIARVYSEQDVAKVVKALCQVARDIAMDTDTCVRALWCLSNQNFTSSHVQASSLIILDTAGEVVCRYIHKISMVEMEALNLLSKLYIQCHSHVIRELQKWYRAVFLLLFSKVPLVQQKALTLATALEKNDCTVLVEWVKEELKKTYLSVMLSRLDENALEHSHVILLVWAHCVRLLGKAVRDTGTFLNQLLKVAEKGFKQKGSLIQSTVYTSWQAIISNFAQEHDVLVNQKRLHLVLLPLTSPAVKECVEQVDVARLNTWWYLIGHLGLSKQQLFVQVCIPFLFFCFGLDPKYSTSNLTTLLASIPVHQSPPSVAHDNGMRKEGLQYSVGSISQALVSKRQLLANQGSRPFVLPQQLFLSGCHAILQFTGCSDSISGSLLNTDLSHYGVYYSTSVVPPEVTGVLVVLLDAILKHCADHKPHVEDQVMSSVIGHITNVVMTAVGESDRKLILSCLLGMFGTSEFERMTTLAVKVKISLHSTKLPFHIRGTVHTKEGLFWRRLQSDMGSSCQKCNMNTHLTCWQEVLTGAKGNVLDLQRVQRELQQLDQRVPDSTCLEMMWSVVARGLQHYVSETSYAKDLNLESELVTVRHVLVFPFLTTQQQKSFTLVLELWPELYHCVNRTVAIETKGPNWFGGIVCADILVACKIMKNVGHFDGHPEVMGVVLRSVLADFNWTHAKTEAARRKDLETVLNLLSWQLATLLVSMPSCAKPYCILLDVTKEMFSQSTTTDGALMICDALAQPLANVWSCIINSSMPITAIQECLCSVASCWSTVIASLNGLTRANYIPSLRILSPLLVVTLNSHIPELVNMAITFWANTFDRCQDIRSILPDKIKEALLEYSRVTKEPLPLNFFTHFSKEVTVVEDSVMATADATEGVVINRPSIPQGEATMPGNQLVLSSPVPKKIEQAVAVTTNHTSTPNLVAATNCAVSSTAPNTSLWSPSISVSPNQSVLELKLSFAGSSPCPTAASVAGSSPCPTVASVAGSSSCPTVASVAGSSSCPTVASVAGSSPCPTIASVTGSGPCPTVASVAGSSPCPTIASVAGSGPCETVASVAGSMSSLSNVAIIGSTSRPAIMPAAGTTSGPTTTTPLKCSDFTSCRVMLGSKRPLECVQPARKKLCTDDVTILDIDPDIIMMSSPAKRQRTSTGVKEVKGSSDGRHPVVCCDDSGDDGDGGAICSVRGGVSAGEATEEHVEKAPPVGVANHDVMEGVANHDAMEGVANHDATEGVVNHDVVEGVIHHVTEGMANHDVIEDTPPIEAIQPVAPPTQEEPDKHLPGSQTSAVRSSDLGSPSSDQSAGIKDAAPRARGKGRGRPRGFAVASRESRSLSLHQRSGDVTSEEGPGHTTRRKSIRARGRGRGAHRHDDEMEEEPIPSSRKRRKSTKTPDGGGAEEHGDASERSNGGNAVAWIVGVTVTPGVQTTPTTNTVDTPTVTTMATPTMCSTGEGAGVLTKRNPLGTSNLVGILKNPRVLSNTNKDRKVKFASGPKLVCFIEPSQEPVAPPTTSVSASSPDQPGTSSSSSACPFFPSLSSCPTPIQQITPAIAGNRSSHGLLQFLKANNIETVGSIASLTEQQVIALPIKVPKVQTLKVALERYEIVWKRSKQQKDNSTDREEPLSHQPPPSAETQPSPSAETQPSLSAETQPSHSAETQPSPSAETQPSHSAETQPSHSVETQPSPSAETQPSPSAETQPSHSVETQLSSTTEAPCQKDLTSPDALPLAHHSDQNGSGFTQSQDMASLSVDQVTLSTPDSQNGAVNPLDDQVTFTPHDDHVTFTSGQDQVTTSSTNSGAVRTPVDDQVDSMDDHPTSQCIVVDLRSNSSPPSSSPPSPPSYDSSNESTCSCSDDGRPGPQYDWLKEESVPLGRAEEFRSSQRTNSDMECNQPISDVCHAVAPFHSSLTHSSSLPAGAVPMEDREVGSNWSKDAVGSQELFSCSSVLGSEGRGLEVPNILPPTTQISSPGTPHLISSLLASTTSSKDTDCSTQTPPTAYSEGCTQTPPLPAPPLCLESGTQTSIPPAYFDDGTQTPPLPAPPVCFENSTQTPPLPVSPPCTDGFAQTVATPTIDGYSQTLRLQLADQSQQACPVVMETTCQTSGPAVDSRGVNTMLQGTDAREVLAQLLSELASHFDGLEFGAQVAELQRYTQQFYAFTSLLITKLNSTK